MLRQAFRDRLKEAMKARDSRTVSTVRLILAALKERDVAARGQGNPEALSEAEIQRMLQAMVKQRRESIALYEQGNRPDLANQENEEIAVIESFLPRQLDEGEIEAAVKAAIGEVGAATLKDMGKVMAALRERHAGVIDLGRAGAVVKRLLG
ncbi:MAG: GatB/YqeY domain-containing protein [Alphaproteobacteria bacterium]|nr:GatB/YqeY domain-containing protein [Alphaproteobacteria bacterium]MBV9377049.1 GatB/YqeY domain-containing protein [Alphaproteobacteria bacterium]MBV9816177.1 GatB/YqeY domain-containing protein [Alphaproteobacteria bacterium]